SAGVTLFTALLSLLTSIKARDDLAMTGEITLRGRVLPVGGIKEKVLAAHRAGLRKVVLPERNKKDLVDVPETTRKEMEFHFVGSIDDLSPFVLEQDPRKDAAERLANYKSNGKDGSKDEKKKKKVAKAGSTEIGA